MRYKLEFDGGSNSMLGETLLLCSSYKIECMNIDVGCEQESTKSQTKLFTQHSFSPFLGW